MSNIRITPTDLTPEELEKINKPLTEAELADIVDEFKQQDLGMADDPEGDKLLRDVMNMALDLALQKCKDEGGDITRFRLFTHYQGYASEIEKLTNPDNKTSPITIKNEQNKN